MWEAQSRKILNVKKTLGEKDRGGKDRGGKDRGGKDRVGKHRRKKTGEERAVGKDRRIKTCHPKRQLSLRKTGGKRLLGKDLASKRPIEFESGWQQDCDVVDHSKRYCF